MSETQKKIKVTVRKRLPCPQCGKGNMFDYYDKPSEDDVCDDCYRPTCEKCSRRVPDKYYYGLANDDMWVTCLHTGWYCPNHSPTNNCDDERCVGCNGAIAWEYEKKMMKNSMIEKQQEEEEEQFVYDLNGKPIQTIKDFKKEFGELLISEGK